MQEPAPMTMRLLRVDVDETGESRFGATEFEMALRDFAPPAPPFHSSDGQPALRFVLIRLPAGWVGEPHVSPKRQLLFCLGGRLKITCGTGEAKVLEAGSGIVLADVTGKGHKSEVISAEPVDAVIIQ